MSDIGTEVPALSRVQIRQAARHLREMLGISGYFPIVELLDVGLSRDLPGYIFDVAEIADMGNHHGLTIPDQNRIIVRLDIYDRACKGHGRDRFTMAHELGHLILHQDVVLAREEANACISRPRYRDSEWQAHTFAGELLIPAHEIRGTKLHDEFCERYGVSESAAKVQWQVYKKEGLL